MDEFTICGGCRGGGIDVASSYIDGRHDGKEAEKIRGGKLQMRNILLAAIFIVMWDSQRMVPTCSKEMEEAIARGEAINPQAQCGYEMQTFTNAQKFMTKQDVNLFLGYDYWGEHPIVSPYANVEVAEVDLNGNVLNDKWGVNEELAKMQ